MHLSEIPIGKEITIVASQGRTKLEFKSKISAHIQNLILINEVTNNFDIPVSFASQSINLEIVYINELKQPIIWKGCQVRHITVEGKDYHRIVQTTPGKKTNRRNAFRIYIGESGLVHVGLSAPVSVKVKDISTNGFAFVTEDTFDPSDTLHLKCNCGDYTIDVDGRIVRKSPIKNSKCFIYGCRISSTKNIDSLAQFVQNRQKRSRAQG